MAVGHVSNVPGTMESCPTHSSCDPNQVRRYFATVPKEWDALYSHESRLRYAVNRWLRSGLFRRYELTFERCGDLTGASVLDVGCGTGRYSIECAKRGASRVVGIDSSRLALQTTRKRLRALGVRPLEERTHEPVPALAG